MAALIEQHLDMTVLVVEDDDASRLLVERVLTQSGYSVSSAKSGVEGLASVEEAIPDLIISDIMMPDMDGLEMLTILRQSPITRGIPVILLTAKDQTKDIVAGFHLGADDYLAKPFRASELQARVRAKIERPPIPADAMPRDRQTNLLSARTFHIECEREVERARRGGSPGCLAVIEIAELMRIRERLGARAEQTLVKQLGELVGRDSRLLDSVGRDESGRFTLLLPETPPEGAEVRLKRALRLIAGKTFPAGGERIHVTPVTGYATYDGRSTAHQVTQQALIALDHAGYHLDLVPVSYQPAMGEAPREESVSRSPRHLRVRSLRETLRLPAQIALVHVVGIVIPFFIYVLLAHVGFDIVPLMYGIVVVALLMTAALIWVEGFAALEEIDPPEATGSPPPVTAIIAAYLPNEAATILDTVEAFLALDYPGALQIILAYNTPRNLPVEATLRQIARRDRRFMPLRVNNSTSKAQNVNAALAEATGEITGVFDADHHPAPDAFTRAWRWIASGYDIVQGHCLVRNGAESAVSRTVAVEFELIYGVSHPGRARVHDFGIFGGSNGYWRTELLHQTRMHGFMLTEDIDSSIRVVGTGHKICSDPGLISRELAPVTLRALWHQRMRWAQGWFQVSRKHLMGSVRSKHLTVRQKAGLAHLLWWREVYPWLSLQMWPIIAYWVWKNGSVHSVNWFIPIFVLTTIFTLSVGPSQVIFAYMLAAPEVRKHRSWFALYLFWAPFYSEFKNLIGRVAQCKEFLGERQWKVTPRSVDRQAAAPPTNDE